MSEKIYIQPVVASGRREAEASLPAAVARGLAEIFDARVMVAKKPVHIPDGVYNPRRHQYNAQMAVQFLTREKGPGKVLAIADFDLYVPSLNFVFGLASIFTGVAIISLARLRPEFYGLPGDRTCFAARAIKEAVHEIGHLYGLDHCPDTSCVMHFSNSLPDTDRKKERPCDHCNRMLKQKGRVE